MLPKVDCALRFAGEIITMHPSAQNARANVLAVRIVCEFILQLPIADQADASTQLSSIDVIRSSLTGKLNEEAEVSASVMRL